MISKTLLISERGQITLPKKLRDLFKTNAIVLEVVDDTHAVISPIPNVAGKLSEFKKKLIYLLKKFEILLGLNLLSKKRINNERVYYRY